jgi:hypothetical protein
MKAPGYNSLRWIKQDWRYLRLGKDIDGNTIIIFDKKCGSAGGRTQSGKARLCLPAKVIKDLKRSKRGRQALIRQIRKKISAPKGSRVPYDPIILEKFRTFQLNDKFKDK